MGQRNIPSIHQMLGLKSEQAYSCLHPDYHIPSGNIANYPNQYTYPVMSSSGNTTDLNLHQVTYRHGMDVKYRDRFNPIQFYHPVSNFDLSSAVPYSIYNTYMFPCFVPLNNGPTDQFAHSIHATTGSIMDEYGGNNHFTDSLRIPSKRKLPEVVTGNYCIANGPANPNFSSASICPISGQLRWEEPNEYGFNLMHSTAFTSPEYLETGNFPTTYGLHGSERSRSHATSAQPQLEFSQRNYVGRSLQPSSNGWVERLENYVSDEGCYNWNYTGAMSYMNGRCLHSGAVESVSMHAQEYQDASTNSNFAFILHPSLFNHHQHLPPPQSTQIHCYNQHTQIAAPSYWPASNLQTSNVYPSANDIGSISTFPRPFPSIAEQVYWSPPEAAQEDSQGSSRILQSEDSEALEISEFYWSRAVSDQHGDMQIDIDDMSYEELLALEEQIGDVNTGLSEDLILKNLKTSVCVPRLSLSLLHLSSHLVNEICIICLEEYEEHGRIGTLDCGHNYHAGCIKKWLLIKNICPICKASALATNKRE